LLRAATARYGHNNETLTLTATLALKLTLTLNPNPIALTLIMNSNLTRMVQVGPSLAMAALRAVTGFVMLTTAYITCYQSSVTVAVVCRAKKYPVPFAKTTRFKNSFILTF